MFLVHSGGSRAGVRGAAHPSLFWVKKEEIDKRKKPAGQVNQKHGYRDVIVYEMLLFQNVFCPRVLICLPEY